MNKYVCFSSGALNKKYDVITVCQCRKACELPCKECKYSDFCKDHDNPDYNEISKLATKRPDLQHCNTCG